MEEKELPINFFSEEIDFELENEEKTSLWLQKIANREGFVVSVINYIFCDDEYLHKINMEYLNHDTYTDIITFDNSEDDQEQVLEGDIFISVERVRENSAELKTTFEQEIHRVMVHGLLHLTGQDDHSVEDKQKMREKENTALELLVINY
ncbi:rRNA maturation RNase YbeY [Bernardetia sp.]|uniref:rRNA maturation RNase YbeY n=1 Tax=Bernardetia sp. TaxID=1937974 RepID=UPI0025BF3805|nr:rRNA maturation RNase YbeY [Bernardetia sp.]